MRRGSYSGSLALWMNGVRVGTWTAGPNGADSLAYDPIWISSPIGRPISLSLPFLPGNAPQRGQHVRAYFENLLPDSKDIRDRLARRFKAKSSDAFHLLAAIGRDCVGALEILHEGEDSRTNSPIQAVALDDRGVARILRQSGNVSVGNAAHDDDPPRISIAGAQEKTALLFYQGRWHLPQGSTPTTHIFKLRLGMVGGSRIDLRHSVENEWLCSLILRAFGLPVAQSEPRQFEDMKVLVVERFDRRWVQNHEGAPTLVRLPQEDLCQAFGVSPDRKYEADGGPGMDAIFDLLDGSMRRDEDRRCFFAALLLFWMLCAADGHAKNFSIFLRPGGRYELTPLYDVLSFHPVLGPGIDQISLHKIKMAMALRSSRPHWKVRDLVRRHWLALASRHGVTAPDGQSAERLIDDLVARTPEVIDRVSAQLPSDFPDELAERIFGGLKASAEGLGR